jgi:putative peptidoglycan lipid II flippase
VLIVDNNLKAITQLNTIVMLTIITQFFLLLKNSLVASHFGVSAELDAFNVTNNISNFIYSFIGAGISTVIIPYLKDINNKKGIEVFISVIYTIGFIILLIILTFREQIIFLISGTNNGYFLDIASKVFVFTVIAGFLNSIIELARAVLEFKGQFIRQKLATLFTTILLVLSFCLSNKVNIYYYASMVLTTTTINIVIHLFFLKRTEFKYNISFNIRNSNFKEMIKLYIPTVLSTGIYQISLLIDTSIASRLDVGSISILNYANSIISMINMLLLSNLTSFIYPRLVKKSTDNDRQKSLIKYILIINFIMCLIIIFFYSIGREGISILFERGKFTSDNTYMVYICVLIFTISLPTNGIRDLIYRYFYIKKDTYSPFVNSIMISIINIVISIVLSNYIGLYGVVIGTVFASYLSLFSILLKFRKKFSIYFDTKNLVFENFKIIVATILTIIFSLVLKNLIVIENIFFVIIIYLFLTLFIYISLLLAFKSRVFKMNLLDSSP